MRTATWILRQRPISRRISWREIWAIVMTTCAMPSSLTRRGRSSVVPSTRIPWITAPFFSGSSSTNPFTSRFVSPRPTISRAASTPARPAPTRRVGTRSSLVAWVVLARRCVELVEEPPQHTQPENAAERQDGPHEDDRDGNPPAAEAIGQGQASRAQGQRRPQGGVEERLDLAQADVAPDEAVDAGEHERDELDDDDVGKLLEGLAELLLGHRKLETEQVGEHERPDEDRDVQGELDAPRQPRPQSTSWSQGQVPAAPAPRGQPRLRCHGEDEGMPRSTAFPPPRPATEGSFHVISEANILIQNRAGYQAKVPDGTGRRASGGQSAGPSPVTAPVGDRHLAS